MAGRIFLANVGANASHRFAGPIFADRTFEFLPIPEDQGLSGDHAVRYRHLKSFNHPGHDLLRYVPPRLWDWPCHYDPEFETMTYGDNCDVSPRGAALKGLEQGDSLFFIARLQDWDVDGPRPRFGFYLIGFLEIERSLRSVTTQPSDSDLRAFVSNAHVRRGLSDSELWDRFWVFKGAGNSKRFPHAVPVTREIADRVFTAADGSPWRWDSNRTDLQVIGSYTRSCRCVIDPSLPMGSDRRDALWDWVFQHE